MPSLPQPKRPIPTPHEGCADGLALADGPARDVLQQAMHRLAQAEAGGLTAAPSDPLRPAALCQALTDMARALSALNAYGLAESYLTRALHWAWMMGSVDTRADLHCALAEVATNAAELAEESGEPPAAVRSARDRSRQHAFEVARLAGHTADPQWELKLLLRASDVFDRGGDHNNAVQLQQRALVLMGLHQDAPEAEDTAPTGVSAPAWAAAAPSQLM